jgi:uncharacterized iron-regulated protein
MHWRKRPDPPELKQALDLMRQLYWQAYDDGWNSALEAAKMLVAANVHIERPGEAT